MIEQLGILPELGVRQAALLGIALLRTGQFARAELPLASAMSQGELEASVEYGNLLRATSQTQRAIKHFERIIPTLQGELLHRAKRWYGVSLYHLADKDSLDIIEEARLGYLSIHDEVTAARISHTLAALRLTRGELREAKQLLDLALPTLAKDPNPRPLLSAYTTLADIQMEIGHLEDAQTTLEAAQQISQGLHDNYSQLQVDSRRTFLKIKGGDYSGFIADLDALRQRADQIGERDIYTFASNNLANHLSRTGQHAQAIKVLAELNEKFPNRTLETRFVSAMLTLRRGDAALALGQLLGVRDDARAQGFHKDSTRATLLAALAAYQMSDLQTALQYLTEAMTELAGWPPGQVQKSLKQELQELQEPLAYARLTPELLPVITAALEQAPTLLTSHYDDLFSDTQVLELNVLGEVPEALLNGVPCILRLTYSVPVLAYLALHPGRSRQEITADLWGDEDPARSGANFRQCLTEIRRVCGAGVILLSGPHREPRYTLSQKISPYLDSQRVRQLVAQGELPAAISLYKGAFLAHLPETDWLMERRRELQQGLTLSLKTMISAAQLNKDDRRVVVLTSAVLAIDPDDLKIEELRLETARRVSSPLDVARFETERHRRLN